jgi:hypothetical protein
MGGAAQAAANTYRGSLEQLHNEWEHLLQDVGTPFLGMMTNMVKGFEDTVTAVDDATGSFQGVAPEIERTLGDMKSLGAEVIPMVSEELIGLDHILGGDAVNAWGAVRDAINSTVGTLDAAVNGIRQAIGAVKDMVQAGSDAGNFVNNQVRKIPFIGGALAGADDSIGGSANNPGRLTSQDAAQWAQVQAWGRSVGSQVSTHTDFNPMVGGPLAKKGGNAAPFSFSPEQITAQPVTEDLKGQSDVVKQLTEAFAGLPKSVDGYNQALAQLKPLIEADQKNENDLAIATDKAQQTYGQAVNAYNSGVAGLRNAQQAYDDYGKSLDGVTKLSKYQKEGLNSLKQSVDDQKQHLDNLKATLNDSKKAYDDLAGSLQKTQTELDGLTKLYQQNQNAINKLSTDWEQYVQKTNMANEESYLSFKMTNEQKYDYYKTFAANIHVVDDATLREKEEAYSKEGQAYNAMLEQEQNSLQKFDQLMQTNTQSMLNELISQHKGASGVIKSIWNDLLQAFIEMCAKMIAESKLVASAEQLFMGMFGGGGAGQSIPDFMNMIDAGGPGSPTGGPSARGGKGIGSAGTSGGVGGGTSGGSIGGGVASPMGRGGFSSSGGAGAGGGYASPGATGSGSFSGFGVGGGFGVGSQGPWASSTAGGSAASPSGSTLLSSGLGLASRFGGGMLGAGLLSGAGGEMLSRMVFGNSAGSEIGGLAGGAAGGILGMLLDRGALIPALSLTGPIGIAAIAALAAAGALFGGGIGSMFGDHFPKADEPDIYQQQQWGQELADLQGSSGGNPMIANGKGFTMDSWTSSQTSGKGWNVLMEDFVAKFRNTQKVLPQELRDGFGEMEKLWGGAQNHADFNSNGKNGMLQLGSGEMAQWTTFWQYINAYGPAVAQLMNQYTSADLYSASLNGTASQMGGYTPGGSPWLIHNFPDVGLPMGSSAGAPEVMIAPSGVSKKTATNINIIQQFGGSSIADANMKNYIIKAIAELPLFAHSDINFN